MSNHPPHSHNPKPAAEEAPRPPTSDEQLKAFWLKNEKNIYIACLAIIIVVVGITVFRNMRDDGEQKIGAEYAAATTPEKLRAFLSANPGHNLAAAAQIRLADEAFAAKNYIEAATNYDKAAANKDSAFAGRARIGAAIARFYSGQTADAEARLKQISADTALAPVIRGEAAYQLATIAAAAGRTEDAKNLYKQVTAVAAETPWAQLAAMQDQALNVNTNTSVTAQPVPSVGVPSIQLPQR